MSKYDIDFVVLWVDTNDANWQRERAKYTPSKNDDISIIRYQNWDNLQYWFRSVAKYAPWVRKIHLVTCEQIPDWLNLNNPKVNLVKHSDYMPSDALPTFNSSAIELGIYTIPDLAEHFVYFNDDMFLTSYVTPEYFFNEGVPYDMPGLLRSPQKIAGNNFSSLMYNNSMILRKHFTKEQLFQNRIFEWLNPAMGLTFLRTARYICQKDFPGFVIPHLSVPYLKSDFAKVWEIEGVALRETQHHRFRSDDDLTHFLVRNWRMCEGNYIPQKSRGKYFSVDGETVAQNVATAIVHNKYPEICINEICTGDIFEQVKSTVNAAFAKVLSDKCEYEK